MLRSSHAAPEDSRSTFEHEDDADLLPALQTACTRASARRGSGGMDLARRLEPEDAVRQFRGRLEHVAERTAVRASADPGGP